MPFTLMKQKGEARVKSAEHLPIGCRTRARPLSFPGGVDNGHGRGGWPYAPQIDRVRATLPTSYGHNREEPGMVRSCAGTVYFIRECIIFC